MAIKSISMQHLFTNFTLSIQRLILKGKCSRIRKWSLVWCKNSVTTVMTVALRIERRAQWQLAIVAILRTWCPRSKAHHTIGRRFSVFQATTWVVRTTFWTPKLKLCSKLMRLIQRLSPSSSKNWSLITIRANSLVKGLAQQLRLFQSA